VPLRPRRCQPRQAGPSTLSARSARRRGPPAGAAAPSRPAARPPSGLTGLRPGCILRRRTWWSMGSGPWSGPWSGRGAMPDGPFIPVIPSIRESNRRRADAAPQDDNLH